MSLYEHVLDGLNLMSALQEVMAAGKAGGIDGITLADIQSNQNKYLGDLQHQLEERRYRPQPGAKIDIPKPDGESRHISIPTIQDKVCQRAVLQVITPILDHQFLPCSYAYRPEKGPIRAVKRVVHALRNEKMIWVCLADVDDFFDSLDIPLLESELRTALADRDLVDLMMMWVRMGSVDHDWRWHDRSFGTPQGAPVSGVLSNLYLNAFDRTLTGRVGSYVRYADNLVVMEKTERQVRQAFEFLQRTLDRQVHLKLNPGTVIKPAQEGFEFLGVLIDPSRVTLSPAKLEAIKSQASSALRQGVSPASLTALGDLMKGWHNYYGDLIDEATLSVVDSQVLSALGAALQDLSWKSHYKKLELSSALEQLPFVSEGARLNRTGTVHGLLNLLPSPVAEPRIPSARARDASQPAPTATSSADAKAPVKPAPHYDVDRVVAQRKREYQQRERASSELLVSSPGSFVGVRDQMICVSHNHVISQRIPLRVVRHITIASAGVSLSSNLLLDCSTQGIGIDFVDKYNNPFARMQWEDDPSSALALAQVDALRDGRAGRTVRAIVGGKISNQISCIRYFLKSRTTNQELSAECDHRCDLMEKLAQSISTLEQYDTDMTTLRGKLLSIEGRSASLYWDCVKDLVETTSDFPGRQGHGSTDLVNSLLNYGYGILYNRVWQAVAQQGLTAGIGFLHTEQKGKPTLVFDLVEEFRQEAVDRPIIATITRHLPLALDNGRLTDETRKLAAARVLERLETPVRYHSTSTPLAEVIVSQVRLLRYVLLGAAPAYHPYHAKW
ncbi:MAG: CRISPR-associated endonuclease Cas1 [Candidatus Cryosericum sp.]